MSHDAVTSPKHRLVMAMLEAREVSETDPDFDQHYVRTWELQPTEAELQAVARHLLAKHRGEEVVQGRQVSAATVATLERTWRGEFDPMPSDSGQAAARAAAKSNIAAGMVEKALAAEGRSVDDLSMDEYVDLVEAARRQVEAVA